MPATRSANCRTLAEYISELIGRLGAGEPRLLERLRQVVGERRARITLDDETILVRFEAGRLEILPDVAEPVAGEGGCRRETTLLLLDGYREVTGAILEGTLTARGDTENLARMFQAIEILLDGSSRIPGLVALSRDYRADPCRLAPAAFTPAAPSPIAIDPGHLHDFERALLGRLDLLP